MQTAVSLPNAAVSARHEAGTKQKSVFKVLLTTHWLPVEVLDPGCPSFFVREVGS